MQSFRDPGSFCLLTLGWSQQILGVLHWICWLQPKVSRMFYGPRPEGSIYVASASVIVRTQLHSCPYLQGKLRNVVSLCAPDSQKKLVWLDNLPICHNVEWIAPAHCDYYIIPGWFPCHHKPHLEGWAALIMQPSTSEPERSTNSHLIPRMTQEPSAPVSYPWP